MRTQGKGNRIQVYSRTSTTYLKYDLQLSRWVIHMPILKIALMQVTNVYIFQEIPRLQALDHIHEPPVNGSHRKLRVNLLDAVIQLISEYPVIPEERILVRPKVHWKN